MHIREEFVPPPDDDGDSVGDIVEKETPVSTPARRSHGVVDNDEPVGSHDEAGYGYGV